MTDGTSAATPEPESSEETKAATDKANEPVDAVPVDAVPVDAAPVDAAPVDAGEESASAPTPESETAVSGPAVNGQPPLRRNIQVGSRRGESTTHELPNKPVMSIPEIAPETVSGAGLPASESALTPAPPPLNIEPPPKVEAPTKRDPLPPDLERAVDEAMSDISVEDLVSTEAAKQAAQEIELESRRRGKIVRTHGENIFFSIGGRHEGVASVRQFKEPPSIGDEMDVVVKSFQADDGLYEVGIPGASVSVSDWSDLSEGALVDARITGANTGGLECMVNQIRGFIPASQIGLFRVEEFAEYIGQKLECVATEVNPRRRNLVLSHRAYLEREKQEARETLLKTLERGLVVDGVVSSLRDFGAFVDIGGIDGLIHISQLSWERVKHPSDVLTEGQRIQVRVEKINSETGKIGLSYRELLEHPWTNVESEFSVGSTVRGQVTRIAKFGAFVRLAAGVEGLIHISELAHHRVRSVSEVLQEEQEIEVKIQSIDTEAQRIGLSLKATQAKPEEAAAEEEPEATATVPKPSHPLKGGFDRPTGGESIGLKW